MSDLPNPQTENIRELARGRQVTDSKALREALDLRELNYEADGGLLSLVDEVELLDESMLRDAARSDTEVELFWGIDSTNSYLMAKRFEQPQICVAEQQLSGRGRRGRHWVSPFGRNIYFSYGFVFPGAMNALSGLSLAVGVEVVKSLRAAGVSAAGLKWPNDVLTPDGKLCGILVELGAATRTGIPVVIGIGVNVHDTKERSGQIDQSWTRVSAYTEVSRNLLLADLVRRIEGLAAEFAQTGLSDCKARWSEFCVHLGQKIFILRGNETVEGLDAGIDERGNLLLESDGVTRAIEAGEVSLRTAL